MKLKVLFETLDVEIRGKKEIEISGICGHSKQVAPGDLFIAEKTDNDQGDFYIEEAIKSGAVALLTDLYNPFITITQIIHKNPRGIKALLAKRFYHHPTKDLYLVGITGTNGKTTTSYLSRHLLQKEEECGLIGTIETVIQASHYPATLTTPDSLILNKAFFEMVKRKCTSCVMEVSSHALSQNRVDEIEFDAAIFTNLTQDHLDYHLTMENYAKSKGQLFEKLSKSSSKKNRVAILNDDDPYSSLMQNRSQEGVIRYGLTSKADVWADQIEFFPDKTLCRMHFYGKAIKVCYPLVGQFNLYNALAAASLSYHKDRDLDKIQEKMFSFPQIKGRMQRVLNKKNLAIFVDFAHTEKALENALVSLRGFAKGNIIVVVGCGGDRDQIKRAKMGKVASFYADMAVFTADNPRSEDPMKIVEQMLSEIQDKKNICVELDRKKAIALAIEKASSNDVVLIAGKGHESTQMLKDKMIAFSDEAIAAELLRDK